MQRATLANRIDARHIDVLDGIRALSIGLVFWFHLWQQSWLMPYWRVPQWLRALGLPAVLSFDFLPRTGYLFVDMMLLISAFCLFLPHARALFYGEPVPRAAAFYKKRLVRIVPPYYLCVLIILLFFALPAHAYTGARELFVDLLSTLTFTQTFVPRVLLATKLNGVLWTAAIEMQFYLIFPLLAACFRKKPIAAYLGMLAVSALYLRGYALSNTDTLRLTVNQLPAFFGVFANGFLASYGFVWLSRHLRRQKWIAALATAGAFACVCILVALLRDAAGANPVQVWQATHRYALSLVFTLFLLCSALAAKWYRALLSNRAAVFLSAISYHVYIWHQWLAVKLKEWRIPDWTGEQPPNLTGDRVWQWQYTLLVVVVTLLVATLLTYLFERPLARRLQKCACPPFIRRMFQTGFKLAPALPEHAMERSYPMHHEFSPKGVCSTKISFDLADGTLTNVAFTNGCEGNLKAIGKLVEGRNAADVAAMLRGNTCRSKPTSCTDQLAQAIEEALAES